jgi:hypothetical protein
MEGNISRDGRYSAADLFEGEDSAMSAFYEQVCRLSPPVAALTTFKHLF